MTPKHVVRTKLRRMHIIKSILKEFKDDDRQLAYLAKKYNLSSTKVLELIRIYCRCKSYRQVYYHGGNNVFPPLRG